MSQQVFESVPSFVTGLAPAVRSVRRVDIERMIRSYGANSTSYVLLEGAKSYFCSNIVDGFIAYQRTTGVIVIGGDPVCRVSDASALLSEFVRSMRGRKLCAYQVSPEMLPAFRANGFGDVQIGKEAVFELDRFSLAGGSMELVRAATNKARREGVVVSEYQPFDSGKETLNAELEDISAEWLREKGNREMGFLLGGLDLNRRTAKRYFVARSGNGAGRIEGFIVCEPIFARKGYYLDVTRRRSDAVRGTMELLTSEICRMLGEEGYEIASMGLAPLANLDDPDLTAHPRLASTMRFIYDRVGMAYDFKHLYRYKAKYHPHAWESRYLCFRPSVGPRILYATIRVRDAFSVREIVAKQFARLFSRTRPQPSEIPPTTAPWKQAASFFFGFLQALLLL
jgi:phosphatidylglycerol lysyltransferase